MTEKNTTPLPPIQGPKMRLTNKHNYDDINRTLEGTQPTVNDAARAMRKHGNGDYLDQFTYIFPSAREDEFITEGHISHELIHLSGRLGHTPFQENMQIAFETGMHFGAALRHASPEKLEEAQDAYQINKDEYDGKVLQYYQKEVAPPLTKRDTAIYIAAGMYLRNKLDSYIAAHMGDKTYAEQVAFCRHFEAHDSRLTHQSKYGPDWKIIGNAPYPLVQLSKAEWRAIEAVALGMREPQQTAYPQRLTPIKEALQHAGWYFDRPKFVEELKAEQEQKALNSKGRTPE